MESKKRKLPARAAARVEAVSKKRTSTPDEQVPPQAMPPPPPPFTIVDQPLPFSIVANRPLPTIEIPQQDDLPTTEYQTVPER